MKYKGIACVAAVLIVSNASTSSVELGTGLDQVVPVDL